MTTPTWLLPDPELDHAHSDLPWLACVLLRHAPGGNPFRPTDPHATLLGSLERIDDRPRADGPLNRTVRLPSVVR